MYILGTLGRTHGLWGKGRPLGTGAGRSTAVLPEDWCSRFQFPRNVKVPGFQRLHAVVVGVAFPHDNKGRGPAPYYRGGKQQKLFPSLNGSCNQGPNGQCLLDSKRAGNTYQRLQIQREPDMVIEQPSEGLLWPCLRCWGNRGKQIMFPVTRESTSHPSSNFIWYTCTQLLCILMGS